MYCILYCFAMGTTDQIRNHFGSSKMPPQFNSKGGGKGQTLWEVGQMEVPLQVPREQRRAIDRKSNEMLADEAVKTEEMEEDLYEKGWTRHPVQGSSDEYWWCRVEYFFETEPRGWSKFLDANTGKEYWWHDSGRWFWVES